MKVYVIRHGESETNLSGRWTGWLDAALTEKGRNDAKKAGELLKGISFDKVFSSDLSRAADTAGIALPGCEAEKSALLREVHLGTLANQPLGCVTEAQRAQIRENGYTMYGGESNTEFVERVRSFRDQLEQLDAECVAVFTHAGWVRTMLDLVVGTRLPRKNVRCANCMVAIFEFDGDEWQLHSWINL